MQPKDNKRNATRQFRDDAVTFMETKTMAADFAKGLRDNYIIHTDPNLTRPVGDHERTTFEKLTFQRKTDPVSEDTQRDTILRNATKAVTESGLKTHFFTVMQDAQRPSVYNLTPDVLAYRKKYIQKSTEYADLGEAITDKQRAKLAALQSITDSFEKLEVPFEQKHQEQEHLKSGYFPYRAAIDSNANGVGVTDLYSRKNASGRWVFTGQMNGCAIAVQNVMDQRMTSAVRIGPDAKAYHFPSPDSNKTKLEKWPEGRQLTSWFGVDGYSSEHVQGAYDGFNALYIKGPAIHVVSQKQNRIMPENEPRATGEVDVLLAGRKPFDASHVTEHGTGGVYGLTHMTRRPEPPRHVEPVEDQAAEHRALSASVVRK